MNRLLTIVDSKYQRLEYLESTGTQYIDTGIVYDNSKTYEIMQDIVLTENIKSSGSGWNAGGAIVDYAGYWSDGTNRTTFDITNRILINIKINSGADSLTEYSYKRISDGEIQTTSRSHSSLGTYAGTTGYPLFCMTTSGGTVPYALTKAKIYASQIKVDGVLVRNLVPVLRKSDNELGMLDLVEGKFYGNAGTGKFTANLDTMYAIIQGSPTQSPYGVFSGFSVGSYLLTQQEIGNKPFELVTKINLTTISALSTIFVGAGNPSLTVHIENSKLNMQIGDGTSWVSSIQTGTTTISANTDYYVKLVFDGTSFIGYLSSDNTNWNKEVEWVNTISVLPTYYLKIGNDRMSSTYYLRGSIDLNRSYIKLGSTKYKLQAVVGYTVVGTLTESPSGVFSGFSSANYLKINVPSGITYTKIELGFKFKTTDRTKTQRCLFNTSNFYIIQTSNIVSVNVMNKNTNNWQSYSGGQITNNEWWWYKIKIDYATKKIVIERTTDGVNFTNFAQMSDAPIHDTKTLNTNGVFFGNTDDSQYLTLDMNFNYIKINNKLWFNGQQA